MPTLHERYLRLGDSARLRITGRIVTVASSGVHIVGEFEEVEPSVLSTELGPDPREGSWFNFQTDPNVSIDGNEFLVDDAGIHWRVVAKEDHPYKPMVRYKVIKKVSDKDT